LLGTCSGWLSWSDTKAEVLIIDWQALLRPAELDELLLLIFTEALKDFPEGADQSRPLPVSLIGAVIVRDMSFENLEVDSATAANPYIHILIAGDVKHCPWHYRLNPLLHSVTLGLD